MRVNYKVPGLVSCCHLCVRQKVIPIPFKVVSLCIMQSLICGMYRSSSEVVLSVRFLVVKHVPFKCPLHDFAFLFIYLFCVRSMFIVDIEELAVY